MLELYTIFKRKFTARHLYYNASLLQSLDLIQHVRKLAWLVNKLPTTHASKELFVVHCMDVRPKYVVLSLWDYL